MKKYYFIYPDGSKSMLDFNTLEKAEQWKRGMYCDCTIATKEVPSMKLGEFIENYSGDIDVYDDYDESVQVAFCGGDVKLTDAGREKFADVMDLDVEIYDSCAIVNVNDLIEDDDETILEGVQRLFYTFAGYCSEEDYDKYVHEVWQDRLEELKDMTV